MGLVNENDASVSLAEKPIVRGAYRPSRAPILPSPAPEREQDWRAEELRLLRAALCRQAPPPDDKYWNDNLTWIGCVDATLDKSAGPGDFVKLVFKATTKDDTDDVWEYYEAHKLAITSAIKSKLPDGNVRIVKITAEKGSLTLIILVQVTIGLIAIAIAVLGNYDNIERNFKRAMPLIKQYAIDAINTLKGFFRGFGLGHA